MSENDHVAIYADIFLCNISVKQQCHFSGIATMKLNKKPVNSLNLEFLTEICINLEKLESTAKGIILTSVSPLKVIFKHIKCEILIHLQASGTSNARCTK